MSEQKPKKPRYTDTTKARRAMLAKRSKYEDAYQYKVLNPSLSTQDLAKKFKVDKSGLHRYIREKNADESTPRIHEAGGAVLEIKKGLDVLAALQDSTNTRENEIAEKAFRALEEYYPQMRSIFAGIQHRVLRALDRETLMMENRGGMNMLEIAQTQTVLKMANDTTNFIPRTPSTQINIQNNQNNTSRKKEPPKIEILPISNKEDLKKAKEIIKVEGEAEDA